MIVSNTAEDKPRNDSFPLLMWIVCYVTNVVALSVRCAVIAIVITTCDVDGIDESIFTEGISKIPKSFLMTRCDIIERVFFPADSPSFHFSMK